MGALHLPFASEAGNGLSSVCIFWAARTGGRGRALGFASLTDLYQNLHVVNRICPRRWRGYTNRPARNGHGAAWSYTTYCRRTRVLAAGTEPLFDAWRGPRFRPFNLPHIGVRCAPNARRRRATVQAARAQFLSRRGRDTYCRSNRQRHTVEHLRIQLDTRSGPQALAPIRLMLDPWRVPDALGDHHRLFRPSYNKLGQVKLAVNRRVGRLTRPDRRNQPNWREGALRSTPLYRVVFLRSLISCASVDGSDSKCRAPPRQNCVTRCLHCRAAATRIGMRISHNVAVS